MEWIEIDPLMPLPTGEVFATNRDGLYLLGELARVNLANIICIGHYEELKAVTHYAIPTKPPQKEKLHVTELVEATKEYSPSEMGKNFIDQIKDRARLEATQSKPNERTDYMLVSDRKPYRSKILGQSYWSELISELRKLPKFVEHSYACLELPYNQITSNLGILKTHGLIKSTGRKMFMITGDIPEDMKCSRKKVTELTKSDERTETDNQNSTNHSQEEGHGG